MSDKQPCISTRMLSSSIKNKFQLPLFSKIQHTQTPNRNKEFLRTTLRRQSVPSNHAIPTVTMRTSQKKRNPSILYDDENYLLIPSLNLSNRKKPTMSFSKKDGKKQSKFIDIYQTQILRKSNCPSNNPTEMEDLKSYEPLKVRKIDFETSHKSNDAIVIKSKNSTAGLSKFIHAYNTSHCSPKPKRTLNISPRHEDITNFDIITGERNIFQKAHTFLRKEQAKLINRERMGSYNGVSANINECGKFHLSTIDNMRSNDDTNHELSIITRQEFQNVNSLFGRSKSQIVNEANCNMKQKFFDLAELTPWG